MRSRAEEGDVAAALRTYKALWDLLDEDYGMEPSAKTQQLVAEIKQGSIEVRSAPPPASAEIVRDPSNRSTTRQASLHGPPNLQARSPCY